MPFECGSRWACPPQAGSRFHALTLFTQTLRQPPTSAGGAAYISPARERWVRSAQNPQRRRCGRSSSLPPPFMSAARSARPAFTPQPSALPANPQAPEARQILFAPRRRLTTPLPAKSPLPSFLFPSPSCYLHLSVASSSPLSSSRSNSHVRQQSHPRRPPRSRSRDPLHFRRPSRRQFFDCHRRVL